MRKFLKTDFFYIFLLLAVGLIIVYPLLNVSHQSMMGDTPPEEAWVSFFYHSLKDFKVWPHWTPLWEFGMPFTGPVSPFFIYLPTLLTFVTKDAFTSLNISMIFSFLGAGISMYFLAKEVWDNSLAAFCAALVYLILPAHIGYLVIAISGALAAYFISPLTLFCLLRFFKELKIRYLVLFSLLLGLEILAYAETVYIYTLFITIPLGLIKVFSLPKDRLLIFKKRIWLFLATSLAVISIVTGSYFISLVKNSEKFGFFDKEIKAQVDYYSYRNLADLFRPPHYSEYGTRPFFYDSQSPVIFLILISLILLFLPRRKDKEKTERILFVALAILGFILCFGPKTPLFSLARHIPFLSKLRVAFRFYHLVILATPFLLVFLFKQIKEKLPRKYPLMALAITALFILGFFPYLKITKAATTDRNNYTSGEKIRDFLLAQPESATQFPPQRKIRIMVQPNWSQLDHFVALNKDIFSIEMAPSSLSWAQDKEIRSYKDILYRSLLSENPQLFEVSAQLFNIDYLLLHMVKERPADKLRNQEYKEVNADTQKIIDQVNSPKFRGIVVPIKTIEDEEGVNYLYRIVKQRPKISFYPLNGRSKMNLFLYPDAESLLNWIYLTVNNADYENLNLANNLFINKNEWNKVNQRFQSWNVSVYDDYKILKLIKISPPPEDPIDVSQFEVNPQGIKAEVKTEEDGLIVLPYANSQRWQATLDGKPTEIVSANANFIGIFVKKGNNKIELKYNYNK